MEFDEVKRIYHKSRESRSDYQFVGKLFNDIKQKYLEEARRLGKDPNQSWNSWSGHNLQKLIAYIIEEYADKNKHPVGITSDDALRRKKLPADLEQVKRNILVLYAEFAVVPDADIVLYDKKSLKVIAILSCKASLRERIAQAAYWKIKLHSAANTRDILCYLVSTDNDGDFLATGENTSRDRIIVEYGELDGAYILRDIPQSAKIKLFDSIFTDLMRFWTNGIANNIKLPSKEIK
ncbi:MAG: hypothetical protein HY741_01330 [Chloroflexi bacterium]|nr:hypothetical protein [Chloroflexota bacterium]